MRKNKMARSVSTVHTGRFCGHYNEGLARRQALALVAVGWKMDRYMSGT
jgi:hypothetical protein